MASLIWGPLIQASLYTGVLYTSQNGVPYTGSLNTGVPKYRRPIYRRPYVRDLTKYPSRVFCTQVPNCTFLLVPHLHHHLEPSPVSRTHVLGGHLSRFHDGMGTGGTLYNTPLLPRRPGASLPLRGIFLLSAFCSLRLSCGSEHPRGGLGCGCGTK